MFLTEAGLPPDTGSTSTGSLTIEKILEEKKVFDIARDFEKLGFDDGNKSWTLPGTDRNSACKMECKLTAHQRPVYLRLCKHYTNHRTCFMCPWRTSPGMA